MYILMGLCTLCTKLETLIHICNIFPRHWPAGFPILDVHNKCSGILAMKLKRQKVKDLRFIAKSLKSDQCKKSWEFTSDMHHEFLKLYIVCTVNKLSSWDYILCLFLDLPSIPSSPCQRSLAWALSFSWCTGSCH